MGGRGGTFRGSDLGPDTGASPPNAGVPLDTDRLRTRVAEDLLGALYDADDRETVAGAVVRALVSNGAVEAAEVVQHAADDRSGPSLQLARAGSGARTEPIGGDPTVELGVAGPVVGDEVLAHASRVLLAGLARVDELDRLRTAARTDPLTSLNNRRAFGERLDAELARLDREGGNIAMLLLDVDDLKSVNDDHGHLAGDALLRRVSEVLRGTTRGTDVVARIGGDEFGLVLPSTTRSGALVLADRIRRLLADRPERPTTTLSLGVATAEQGTTAQRLLASADRALYAAKAAGKDRAVATLDDGA